MLERFMQHCDRWVLWMLQLEYVYMRMNISQHKRRDPRAPLWPDVVLERLDATLERMHLVLCDGDAQQVQDYLLEWEGPQQLVLTSFAKVDACILGIKFERTKLPSRKKKHATTSIGK
jgi:hypothetical protein